MTAVEPILAAHPWKSNAELIADCARLGYLHAEWLTLDPTYGRGRWWNGWRPDVLITSDLKTGTDFRALPWEDDTFDAVAFDPPYKLNGTPALGDFDDAYGIAQPRTWQERHQLIRDGIYECVRVLRVGRFLLLKCQDQVCSGRVRWQTLEFAAHAERAGCRLIDRFDMLGGRPQPARTRADGKPSVQQHARRNMSTLLILRKVVG